jgi:hypothetical protein
MYDCALVTAAKCGNYDLVKHFALKGATYFNLAMDQATKKNNVNMIKYIEELSSEMFGGAIINYDERAYRAVSIGNINILKYFLEKGADIKAILIRLIQGKNSQDKNDQYITALKYIIELNDASKKQQYYEYFAIS